MNPLTGMADDYHDKIMIIVIIGDFFLIDVPIRDVEGFFLKGSKSQPDNFFKRVVRVSSQAPTAQMAEASRLMIISQTTCISGKGTVKSDDDVL